MEVESRTDERVARKKTTTRRRERQGEVPRARLHPSDWQWALTLYRAARADKASGAVGGLVYDYWPEEENAAQLVASLLSGSTRREAVLEQLRTLRETKLDSAILAVSAASSALRRHVARSLPEASDRAQTSPLARASALLADASTRDDIAAKLATPQTGSLARAFESRSMNALALAQTCEWLALAVAPALGAIYDPHMEADLLSQHAALVVEMRLFARFLARETRELTRPVLEATLFGLLAAGPAQADARNRFACALAGIAPPDDTAALETAAEEVLAVLSAVNQDAFWERQPPFDYPWLQKWLAVLDNARPRAMSRLKTKKARAAIDGESDSEEEEDDVETVRDDEEDVTVVARVQELAKTLAMAALVDDPLGGLV